MEERTYFEEIENHICCEHCMEVYLTTINCPICKESIAIEIDYKECDCDCGSVFYLHKVDKEYKMMLTLKSTDNNILKPTR